MPRLAVEKKTPRWADCRAPRPGRVRRGRSSGAGEQRLLSIATASHESRRRPSAVAWCRSRRVSRRRRQSRWTERTPPGIPFRSPDSAAGACARGHATGACKPLSQNNRSFQSVLLLFRCMQFLVSFFYKRYKREKIFSQRKARYFYMKSPRDRESRYSLNQALARTQLRVSIMKLKYVRAHFYEFCTGLKI